MGAGNSNLYPTLDTKKVFKYNSARSNEVKNLSSGIVIKLGEKVPSIFKPNSVVQKRNGAEVIMERYYNEKGEPYLDIDYTNHGNPTMHQIVPHVHSISYEANGTIRREKPGRKIK